MKVKRSFPLISIEKVEYSETHDPTIFRLIFSNFIEILQAETAEEASDWVEKISEGIYIYTTTVKPAIVDHPR